MKLTPFKIGCITIAAAALLFLSFGTNKPELLTALDQRVTDTMFKWRGSMPAAPQIIIVDLDERSLREIGQWPWPRDTVAALLRRIADAGAVAIGLDMVFAEPDRTSPERYLAQLQQRYPDLFVSEDLRQLLTQKNLDHDQILGDILAETPSVLGYVFQFIDDGLKTSEQSPFPEAIIRIDQPAATFAELTLFSAYRPILNVAAISRARSEGFFNVFPDLDGIIRKVPLLIELDGLPYPSLALELARIGMGEDTVTIHVDPTPHNHRRALLGISVGSRFIPTDERGQLSVNFRGPAYSFTYVSAVDVLAGIDPARLRDRIVLFGTSAAGLYDLRATPFAAIYPGVEIQATVIDNILRADPLIHDTALEIGLTYLVMIVGGLLLTCLLAYTGPIAGGCGAVLLISATMAGNYFFLFGQQLVVGLSYPLAVLVVLFLVITLFNYFFEGRQKRSISKAFSQYVPPGLVDEMALRPEDLALGGESREMTVLFSDVRGFTRIAETMEASELARLMNELLTPMTRIIHQHRGTIDKYMGDAIMAFWGAPLPDTEHPRHALEAGLAMVAVIPQLQQEFVARGWPPIRIGVGLNSGMMNVGNMGSEFRMAYTVLGDAVNLGSRLEGLTREYGVAIIISETTRQQVPDIACRELDRVRVKGKDQPVTIYEPLGAAATLNAATRAELKIHDQALVAYRLRRFEEAAALFETLSQEQPQRLLYQLYRQRVAQFQLSPPPPDWDGSFTHTSK